VREFDIEALQRRSRADGADLLVGALITRDDRRIFAQKRSLTRKLYPGCWDIAGGHVELGEWFLEALSREVYEETGWTIKDVLGLIGTFEWYKEYGAFSRKVRECVFLVTVENIGEGPRLETDLASEHRWVSEADIDLLRENRSPEDDYMVTLFKAGFQLSQTLRENNP
jgi:8-oxo-dGTP diphosphatase